MSFASTPVTRTLVLGLVGASIAASLFDVKHYFYISVGTHILQYRQTWRALIWQLCYTNSSEVLFAAMILYNLRIVEQQWGSRKYAVSLVVFFMLTRDGVANAGSVVHPRLGASHISHPANSPDGNSAATDLGSI
jgi:hypothetical protein